MTSLIHGGHVRLLDGGRVEYWEGSICRWRSGWGPWATVAALGKDARRLTKWEERSRAYAAQAGYSDDELGG